VTSIDLTFQSIRESFESPNPLGLAFVGLAILIFIGFIWFFRAYDLRHFFTGRFKYWRRVWRGEPVSTDRIERNLEVLISLPTDPLPFRTKTFNISPHGMFVRMDPPMSVGDHFRFILKVTPERAISGRAEVKWQHWKATPLTPRGMGCKLFQLSEDDQNFLRKYLKSLKK
jgi:hypothetical protein